MSDVDKLWELQTVLSALNERERQMAVKPESFAVVESEYDAANDEMTRLQQQLDTLGKERRRVDGELSDQQETLKKYQGQLMQVKNQQQYAAAWKEIDATRKHVKELEDSTLKTMTDVVQGSVADRKLYLGLLGTFAAVALALAIAGIYGVMSYGVTQRTREIGIRLALGSQTTRVQGLVVWQGTKLALLGLAIGLPAAFLATKLLRSVLYGVAPGDLPTLVVVAAMLAVVSVIASYLPSRRVTSVDPIIAMRAE